MKASSVLCLLALLSVSLGDPTYWTVSLPNDNPGSPEAREFQTLTNIPGSSYNVLFGGVMFNQTYSSLNDTWVLDTSSLIWKQTSPAVSPQARGYHTAGVTSDGMVVIFGGSNEAVPKAFFNDIWRYNLRSNTWTQDKTTVPSIILARTYAAGIVVGDSFYIFGGYAQALQEVTNDVWSYNLTSNVWSLHRANGGSGNDIPKPRQGHSANFFNDTVNGPSIVFFGGYNGTGGMSDTWQYVISTAKWMQLTTDQDPMGPHPRWGHSAISTTDSNLTVVIFGGSYVGGAINPYYNDVWYLQWTSGGWNWTLALPDGDTEGPQRRGGHSSVISAGSAFTFGGYALYIGLLNDLWELLNF